MTALEEAAGDRLDEPIERLAYHAVRGKVWDKAFQYCHQAGVKVREQSAYRAAVAHFEQAVCKWQTCRAFWSTYVPLRPWPKRSAISGG